MARVTFFAFDSSSYDWRELLTCSAEVGSYEANPRTGGPSYSVRIKNRPGGRSPHVMFEHAHISMHGRQITVTGFVRYGADGEPLGVGEVDEYADRGEQVPGYEMTRLAVQV